MNLWPTCEASSCKLYEFRLQVVELSDNETASWQFLKQNGYEFTMEEFRAAQDAIYKEYGLTPM